jgi:Flp pilus assembly protein TadG
MLGRSKRHRRPRRGIAIAELAVVLAVLILICLAACDFGRVFYNAIVLDNCAYNGAMYASNATLAAQMPYSSVQAAALADWPSSLTPSPTISSASGTDSNGVSYITVTATQSFQTIIDYPLMPSNVTLSRTVQMAIVP